jgi:hypothetical protein
MKIKSLGSVTPCSNGHTGHMDFNARATNKNVKDVRVHLTCKHDGLFCIVPSVSVPYMIPTLDECQEDGVDLRFAITPLNAEPGKSYECELHYYWKYCDDKKDAVEHHKVETVTVPVHASDSAYFAIGIAKTLQEKSEKFYTDMMDKGQDAQNQQWAVFGGSKLDPARVAVNETSFNWAMSLVELGSRIYRTQVEAVNKSVSAAAANADADDPNGPADDDAGDGDPRP